MLSKAVAFGIVELKLIADGTIPKFEEENGKILGRMMIDLCEIPENLKDEIEITDSTYAFETTFDFYDVAIGVAIDVKAMKTKSELWLTPQTENFEEPDKEWAEYFLKTLGRHIDSEGFGVPIYAFVNETAGFEFASAKPN